MSKISHVYHCAALVSFFKADFEACIQNNRVATANVINFSLRNKIEKLCYVSSTAAVGVNAKGASTEANKWEPGSEVSGYSVSKFLAEKEVWRGIEEGLNAVIINPCVIFGREIGIVVLWLFLKRPKKECLFSAWFKCHC